MVTFIVEKKSGVFPDVVWKKVFERELTSVEVPFLNLHNVADSLHILFPGVEYRVVIIC